MKERFLLLLGAFLAVPAGSVPLTIALRLPPSAAGKALTAKLTLAPLNGAGVEARSLSASVPGTAEPDVPPGSAWQLSVGVQGYWSAPRIVVGGQVARPVELLPAGALAGEVVMPGGEAVPPALTLRFRSAPGAAHALEETAESCAIVERHFRCDLPAGSLDLRLRARGFLTVYRWGVLVPLHGKLELGSLQLRPGSSVVGWVDAPARDFRFQDGSVELAPQVAGVPSTAAESGRREERTVQTKVNTRGFFEFSAVAPGGYVLVVRHPGYAPTRLFPVLVYANAETEPRPIQLQPAVRFEARLEPPADPYGTRWQIVLWKRGAVPGQLDVVSRSVAASDGVWRADAVEPGDYVLEVRGAYSSRWAFKDLSLQPGMAPYEVHLPLVEVEGTVAIGDDPLESLLWFGGQNGAQRVAARSDRKGRFAVVLPQRPSWDVQVENAPLHISGWVKNLAIREVPGTRAAKVTIELPDTTVRGDVQDDQGRAVPKADVMAVGDQVASAVAVAPDGGFEFKGFDPGTWRFEAQAAGGADGLFADSVEISLADHQAVEAVHLVLRKRILVSGQVVTPAGDPLPGAKVTGLIEQAARPLSSVEPSAYSDVNGVFELRLPAETQGLQLTVMPPGYAVTQLRVDARSSAPLVIPVSQVGGTVVVEYASRAAAEAPWLRGSTSLFHEYLLPYPTPLLDWAAINGTVQPSAARFVLPMLEPGRYTACWKTGSLVAASGLLPGGSDASCATGELSPFGELLLNIPVPESEKPPTAP